MALFGFCVVCCFFVHVVNGYILRSIPQIILACFGICSIGIFLLWGNWKYAAYQKTKKGFSRVIGSLFAGVSIVFFGGIVVAGLWIMGFSYRPEHVVVRNDIKMVASVNSFLDEMVYYYQYKNVFFYGKELGYEYYGSGGNDPLVQTPAPTPVRWVFYDLDGNIIESGPEDTISEKDILAQAEKRSTEIALSYRELYRKASKEKSAHRPNQTVISQKDIDAMEVFLMFRQNFCRLKRQGLFTIFCYSIEMEIPV